jgi:hypothetical protein
MAHSQVYAIAARTDLGINREAPLKESCPHGVLEIVRLTFSSRGPFRG